MKLLLFKDDIIEETKLPEKIKGQYWVKDGTKKLLCIEAMETSWVLKSYRNTSILDSNNYPIQNINLQENKFYSIFYADESKKLLLYVESQDLNRMTFTKKVILGDCTLTIGRDSDCNIIFDSKLVSSKHATVQFERNKVIVSDLSSSNGTYLNNIKIKNKTAQPGDVIFIMGLRIILGKNYFAYNNPNGVVTVESRLIKDYEEQEVQESIEANDEYVENEDYFYRSPRFRRDIAGKIIKIDPPPQKEGGDDMPMIMTLGPAIVMGISSAFTALFSVFTTMASGGSIMNALPSLIMAGGMLVGSILFPIIIKQYQKVQRFRKERKRKKLYRKYIDNIKNEISSEIHHQSEIFNENYVDAADCVHRIQYKDRNLWERTVDHNDFLCIRLGIGNLPWLGKLDIPEKTFTLERDPLQDELYALADAPKILENVPVTVSLRENPVCGIIGSREIVCDTVKNLIIQLAALHSYDELNLIFLYNEQENSSWEFVKWLPHVWSIDKSIRFIARTDEEIRELDTYFKKILAQRQSENKENADLPYYVIFAMDKKAAEKVQFLNELLHKNLKLGFSVVFLYNELQNLPKECSTVVEISGKDSKIYNKNDISGAYTSFIPDDKLTCDIRELTSTMSNIHLDLGSKGYSLPTTLTFLEMFDVGKIEHLNVLSRWKENDPTKSLQCQIGVNSNGDLFYLDMHEKFHGPHGLIAGMTGSGKSEFVMTLILSLAVNYHPYEVAFILIDYKGGGMANAFTKLPHVVGTITNLDGAAVKRSLVAIESELKRRQTIFSEASKKTGISNIDIYKYQKLYREGTVAEPLPHLFIISDEFAELKTQQPEFMTQLVSAARIGRSLGIHLILATQKPSGVVDDQIWSNTKFRICLKVQEKQDSMDVIKRQDAAELSVTGRFYLQVGFNELFELGQSAWSGAPYLPADKIEKKNDISVTAVDILGRTIENVRFNNSVQVKRPPKQVDEITEYLARLAEEENLKISKIWLEPISEFIFVNDIRKKYQVNDESFKLDPVIGEIDDPAHQQQRVFKVSLSDEGNAVVYGSAGSGKTTFITTALYDLLSHHTPEQLNVYILDFSSETLRAFSRAPHVGDVLIADDKEKIINLFKMLSSELISRKKLFSEYGGEYASFVKRSETKLPMILVVIHNYAAFSELFDDLDDVAAILTREGIKYGIYFILTALTTNGVSYRIAQNIHQTIVLQLNDETDYSALLGRTDGMIPSKFKGRGLIRQGDLYEFQTAYVDQSDDVFEFVKKHCEQLRKEWIGECARHVPTLPKHIDSEDLANEVKNLQDGTLIIGVEKSNLQYYKYDLFKSFIHIVIGNEYTQDGFLQGLAQAAMTQDHYEVTVLDPKQGFYCEESSAIYKYYNECFDDVLIELFNTLVLRNNTTKQAKKNGNPLPEYPHELYIINGFTALQSRLSDDCKDKLSVLLEKGEKEYAITVIISDSAADLSSCTSSPWYSKHIRSGYGIWVGSGISDQILINVNSTTQEMYKPLPDGMGYCIQKGHASLLKLLDSKNMEVLE